MSSDHSHQYKISVVIPCYRVTEHIMEVIGKIPGFVSMVYCIDDCCPDGSGKYIEEKNEDPRIAVIYHEKNKGVGGAMKTGYQYAIRGGADIIVKIDGDGQMDPALIASFTEPILLGDCDYTKGNRFYSPENVSKMPWIRIAGNSVLSFISKFSTGYWNLFDPTNGYTAIHSNVFNLLPSDKINDGYFFESDMLFRLNTVRAVIVDVPMDARYDDETSYINVLESIVSFSYKHTVNFTKRIFYSYFLRDFNAASIEWILGPALLIFGVIFGTVKWQESIALSIEASSGMVMLAALPTIMGLQLLLSAISFDINNQPSTPIQSFIRNR